MRGLSDQWNNESVPETDSQPVCQPLTDKPSGVLPLKWMWVQHCTVRTGCLLDCFSPKGKRKEATVQGGNINNIMDASRRESRGERHTDMSNYSDNWKSCSLSAISRCFLGGLHSHSNNFSPGLYAVQACWAHPRFIVQEEQWWHPLKAFKMADMCLLEDCVISNFICAREGVYFLLHKVSSSRRTGV